MLASVDAGWDITQEPVRGSYPGPWWIGLSGGERTSRRNAFTLPRPPMSHLTGLRPLEGGDGRSVFRLPASPWFQTATGMFLGSMSIWAADAPFGGCIMSVLEPGKVVTTSELTMSFLRPATVGSGSLTATARMIHVGRTQGLSEARVEDASGRLIAHGTSRLFILSFPSWPEPPDDITPAELPAYDTPDPYERPLDWEPYPADTWETRSGLEIFQSVAKGDLPRWPLGRLFGLRIADVDEGTATFTMPATEWLHSPARMLYGGALAVLADAALSASIATTLPPRTAYATLDLHMNYLRPVFGDGREVVARASVVHRGRTLAVARSEVTNADGKTVVVATGSAMLFPGRSWDALVVPADEEPPGDDDD